MRSRNSYDGVAAVQSIARATRAIRHGAMSVGILGGLRFYNIGNLCHLLGQHQESFQAGRAREIESDLIFLDQMGVAEGAAYRGQLAWARGQNEDAVGHMRRAIELNPKAEEHASLLAAYEAMDQRPKEDDSREET